MIRGVLVIKPTNRKEIRVPIATTEEATAYLDSIGAPKEDQGWRAPWGFDRGTLSCIRPTGGPIWFSLSNIDSFWLEREEHPDA